ncbi:hypothetical protein ACF07F_15895 [Streptomyces sp. NPDC015237]|uniref:hypothetical protein n=1 Tax=Streptomyces sp. NPDC015237 TaxID=3364949 RepID=UPI0036FA43E8
MAHRPYPVTARSWRQIMRRYRYARPPHSPASPGGPVGEYQLSTRQHSGRATG